jgi:chitinase
MSRHFFAFAAIMLLVCFPADAQMQSSRTFAPYVDISKMADRLSYIQSQAGTKILTLAFVVGGKGCEPTWLGNSPVASDTTISAAITKFRAARGDIVIAFGGYDALELAQTCNDVPSLQAAYQAVVDKYRLRVLDLDIEHAAIEDPISIDRRSEALTALAAANPGIQINYTLPATPAGLKDVSVDVIKSAVKFHTPVAVVNLMAMDYGTPVLTGAMGPNAVASASGAASQLKALGLSASIGITPMIGVNDTPGETFTLDDAQVVTSYALANSNTVTWLAFWSIGRDNGGCFGKVSPYCSGLPQKDWDFTHIFQKFTQ